LQKVPLIKIRYVQNSFKDPHQVYSPWHLRQGETDVEWLFCGIKAEEASAGLIIRPWVSAPVDEKGKAAASFMSWFQGWFHLSSTLGLLAGGRLS
jgi:hypothetical protein